MDRYKIIDDRVLGSDLIPPIIRVLDFAGLMSIILSYTRNRRSDRCLREKIFGGEKALGGDLNFFLLLNR